MAEGLARTQRGRKILFLADSKAVIAAVRKAGRMGKARSSHLKKVVDEIGARGPGMVGKGTHGHPRERGSRCVGQRSCGGGATG